MTGRLEREARRGKKTGPGVRSRRQQWTHSRARQAAAPVHPVLPVPAGPGTGAKYKINCAKYTNSNPKYVFLNMCSLTTQVSHIKSLSADAEKIYRRLKPSVVMGVGLASPNEE